MKLLLHIGTEKTGTTSMQRFCHRHRAALRARAGVIWPDRLGGENHRLVSVLGMSAATADEFASAHGVEDDATLAALQQKVRTGLARQVEADPGARACLLSSEHFHSRLRSPDAVAALREALAGLFDGVEIFVHLRPQIDVAVSLASTQSRVGGAVRRGFFDQVAPRAIYYDYDRLVAMWEAAFGADAVTCLAFRAQPDFLGFLSARIGFDPAGLPPPRRLNEALDVQTMALVNALVESGGSERIDFRVLDRLPVTERLAPDLLTAQGVQARFVPGNQALIARRDDLAPGQLQPDWSRYSGTGNLDLLESRSGFPHALAHLVAAYNAAIAAAGGRAEDGSRGPGAGGARDRPPGQGGHGTGDGGTAEDGARGTGGPVASTGGTRPAAGAERPVRGAAPDGTAPDGAAAQARTPGPAAPRDEAPGATRPEGAAGDGTGDGTGDPRRGGAAGTGRAP